MLKKAAIIAAASAASLVALSPMAFAGDTGLEADSAQGHGHGHGHGPEHGHGHHGHNQNSHGLVNGLNGNNVNVPIQLCNNDVMGQVGLVPVQDVAENPTFSGLNGALALLGQADANQHGTSGNIRSCQADTGGAGYGND